MDLSSKLRFYTRISSPEKSRNNTRERIRYFFTCVLYRQSAADTSLAFRATRSNWWMNSKTFTILNTRYFYRNFLGLWRLKHQKNPYRTNQIAALGYVSRTIRASFSSVWEVFKFQRSNGGFGESSSYNGFIFQNKKYWLFCVLTCILPRCMRNAILDGWNISYYL